MGGLLGGSGSSLRTGATEGLTCGRSDLGCWSLLRLCCSFSTGRMAKILTYHNDDSIHHVYKQNDSIAQHEPCQADRRSKNVRLRELVPSSSCRQTYDRATARQKSFASFRSLSSCFSCRIHLQVLWLKVVAENFQPEEADYHHRDLIHSKIECEVKVVNNIVKRHPLPGMIYVTCHTYPSHRGSSAVVAGPGHRVDVASRLQRAPSLQQSGYRTCPARTA